jgi:hypothetical protein
MWFESLEAVKQFVGENHEAAHVPGDAQAVLSSVDARATHFDVVERRPRDRPSHSPNPR